MPTRKRTRTGEGRGGNGGTAFREGARRTAGPEAAGEGRLLCERERW